VGADFARAVGEVFTNIKADEFCFFCVWAFSVNNMRIYGLSISRQLVMLQVAHHLSASGHVGRGNLWRDNHIHFRCCRDIHRLWRHA
jgi:hypothetical protein